MGPCERGDATATASAAFPSRGIRRAAGFTAKGLGQSPSLLVLVPQHEPFLPPPFSPSSAALEEQGVSRRCWGRKSFLQRWRWLKPVPEGPVWVLCIGRRRGAPLISKLSRDPHPSEALWCCLLPTTPSKLNNTDPLLPRFSHRHCGPPVPGSHWSLSATLPLKSSCPPSPEEEGSSTVQARTYVEYWEEIFELATQSTSSTAGKAWAKSDHYSDLQCLEGQTAGLGSAITFIHPGQERTSPLLPAMGDVCKWWRALTRGDSPVTVLSLPSRLEWKQLCSETVFQRCGRFELENTAIT